MNHDDVIELLPWLANGSLTDAEAATVRGHLQDCPSCREQLAETQFAGRLHALAHPASDALAAHVLGDSTSAAEAEIDRHLDVCDACRAETELARASLEATAQAPSMAAPGRATTSAWLFQAAAVAILALGATIAMLATWRAQSAHRDLTSRNATLELRVAELATASARAAMAEERVKQLEQEVAQSRLPVAGVRVVELTPNGVQRGEQIEPIARIAADRSAIVTLVLPLSRSAPDGQYRLRLLTDDGRELFVADGVVADERGSLTLLLPTALLPAEKLRVEVRANEPAFRLVSTYELLVTRPLAGATDHAAPR